jgi:hypothetical protein
MEGRLAEDVCIHMGLGDGISDILGELSQQILLLMKE